MSVTSTITWPAFGTLITAAEARTILLDRLGEEPELGEVIAFIDYIEHGPGPRPASVKRRARRHQSRRWLAAHTPRACRECGTVFTPAGVRQVYCSASCRKRYAYRAPRRTKNARPDPTYRGGHSTPRNPNGGGASLVTNRGVRPPICAHCGEPFEPKRTDQRFCKNKCRQAAYRERRREEEPTS